MLSFDEIVDEYRNRKDGRGPIFERMTQAKDHFNGDIVIPLPDMNEADKPAVANIVTQGLDQTAMRVASTLPNLHFPAVQPGKDKGVQSEEWARMRRLATAAWWQESKLKRKLRRAARYLVGYAETPMVVVPNFERKMPEYRLRHPLGAYPSPQVQWDDDQPEDYIFTYQKTFGWLRRTHPDAAASMARKKKGLDDNSIIELIEYQGPHEIVMGVVAVNSEASGYEKLWYPHDQVDDTVGGAQELYRAENRAGISLAVNTSRISIDKLQGQFDQVFGLFQNQAKLMALETLAVQKAIFPDMALVGTTPGRTPVLINGEWRDGRSGDINVVKDGKLDVVQLNPGYMTQPMIDRYERSVRTSGIPSQFNNESPTNIATGRLGDQLLSATVDFPIQEYQESLGDMLHDANVRAVHVARNWFGDDDVPFSVSFAGANGRGKYKAGMHFETTDHRVSYSAPGADVNALMIGIGQRLGLGTISRYSAMFQDPLIEDPEFEYQKVTSERLQQALLDFVQQQVAQGMLDPQDVLLLTEEVEKGENVIEAWKKAQRAAQERQAEQQQLQADQAGGPEGQPGLSPPDQAEVSPQVGSPQPSMQNLANMLGTLRQPRMQASPMAGPGRGAPATPVGG